MFVVCFNPHPGTLACPFTFEVLRTRELTPIPYLSVVFTFGLIVGCIKEFGGVSYKVYGIGTIYMKYTGSH
jgi:hypothetical protein